MYTYVFSPKELPRYNANLMWVHGAPRSPPVRVTQGVCVQHTRYSSQTSVHVKAAAAMGCCCCRMFLEPRIARHLGPEDGRILRIDMDCPWLEHQDSRSCWQWGGAGALVLTDRKLWFVLSGLERCEELDLCLSTFFLTISASRYYVPMYLDMSTSPWVGSSAWTRPYAS